MKILYIMPSGRGWDPVTRMAHLAAELLEADLVAMPETKLLAIARRLGSFAPRRHGQENCLVIAPAPRHLRAVIRGDFLHGFGHVTGWVIDSFWDDRIPFVARQRHFDQLFVADQEVVDSWRRATGVPTGWLPIGSDVLRMGSDSADRPIDLQRLGRMPREWEDDDETRCACSAVGLQFSGRPAFGEESLSNQRGLMAQLGRAKFTLSFTNRVSPASYTHPFREYLTARWTDAIASGAVVAGIAPNCASARDLLWPEATVELGTVDRAGGIREIARAARLWDRDTPRINHLRALERLDWRWRFSELARIVGIKSEHLDAELDRLSAAIKLNQSRTTTLPRDEMI